MDARRRYRIAAASLFWLFAFRSRGKSPPGYVVRGWLPDRGVGGSFIMGRNRNRRRSGRCRGVGPRCGTGEFDSALGVDCSCFRRNTRFSVLSSSSFSCLCCTRDSAASLHGNANVPPILAIDEHEEGRDGNETSEHDTFRSPESSLASAAEPSALGVLQTTTGTGTIPPTANKKSHSLSVCLVPPSRGQIRRNSRGDDGLDDVVDVEHLWEALTEMRRSLRDPGFFRWPPHINLLYPFVCEEIDEDEDEDEDEDADDGTNVRSNQSDGRLAKLRRAARVVDPFWVTLDLDPETFGTFGDATRGVLWVPPRGQHRSHSSDPIAELQALLEVEFPVCSESLKDRSFVPHMSLSSKFDSLEGARSAAKSLAEARAGSTEGTLVSFWCKEFYLLERDGHGGQFRKRATIALGSSSRGDSYDDDDEDGIRLHDPPQHFPSMPTVEEAWVREEYRLLRARRKHNSRTNLRKRGSGGRSYRARRRWKKEQQQLQQQKQQTNSEGANAPLWHDTASIVARKRAERTARRAQIMASTNNGSAT